ncbi:MAG: hypothetical protein JWM98_2527 [Thermoleophilia bacterium]|nr:hypothetical protein [Thermoleophilia bacterium]
MITAPVASSPRPANVVARLVRDDMPGMGVEWVTKGARVQPDTTYATAADAVTAAAALSGDDDPAVAVFREGGAFTLYGLGLQNPSFGGAQPYDPALENDYVARTVHGRNLVAIVDGAEQADLMSAASFRSYERYAGGE